MCIFHRHLHGLKITKRKCGSWFKKMHVELNPGIPTTNQRWNDLTMHLTQGKKMGARFFRARMDNGGTRGCEAQTRREEDIRQLHLFRWISAGIRNPQLSDCQWDTPTMTQMAEQRLYRCYAWLEYNTRKTVGQQPRDGSTRNGKTKTRSNHFARINVVGSVQIQIEI